MPRPYQSGVYTFDQFGEDAFKSFEMWPGLASKDDFKGNLKHKSLADRVCPRTDCGDVESMDHFLPRCLLNIEVCKKVGVVGFPFLSCMSYAKWMYGAY